MYKRQDLNTAITNLNTLKDELTNLGTDHFTDIISNIDNDVETYTNKVSEIEEAEKKAAEEAETVSYTHLDVYKRQG